MSKATILWLCYMACGSLLIVPRPGFEPVSLAVEAQSPNHWTARKFPKAIVVIFVLFLKSEVILAQTQGEISS